MRFWIFDFEYWLTWLSLAIGLGVTGLILVISRVFAPRRSALGPADDDLPWEDLLEKLKAHQREHGGQLPDTWEKLSSSDLLKVLLRDIPKAPGAVAQAVAAADEATYLQSGSQRRGSRRRWLNPTEVRLTSPLRDEPHKGLVFNRSAGGLAILTDQDHPIDSILFLRAAEAPSSVPQVKICVRHTRQAGKLWVVGCQYLQEIPWNVKVWFG